MAIPIESRSKHTLMLSLVSTQQQQICNAQELKIKQHILGLFPSESATKNMRNYSDIVTIFDSCRYRNGSRSTTQRHLMKNTFGRLLVDIFATMCCNIDIFRIKLAQFVNRTKQSINSRTLKRWQHLERESCMHIIGY